MFRSPVSSGYLHPYQKQTADADAIVYHHRFSHPRHPRPPRQVRNLHLLYYGIPLKVETDWLVVLRVSDIGYPQFVTRLSVFFFYFVPSCTKIER